MELVTGWMDIESDGHTVRAYHARPESASTPLPAILVIQEIWGVDAHIQDLTRRYAEAGYVAVAPDLYADSGIRPEPLSDARVAECKAFLNTLPPSAWHDEAARAAEIAKLPQPRRIRVGETMGRLLGGDRPMGRWLEELSAVVSFLGGWQPTQGRKVGSVGYCMGGGLSAALATTEPRLAAAAIFYGVAPAEDAMKAIACPVMGFYGGDDARITDGVPAFKAAMEKAGKSYEAHVYPDTPHAFFNDTRVSYRVEAARDAWSRVLRLFAENLAPAAA